MTEAAAITRERALEVNHDERTKLFQKATILLCENKINSHNLIFSIPTITERKDREAYEHWLNYPGPISCEFCEKWKEGRISLCRSEYRPNFDFLDRTLPTKNPKSILLRISAELMMGKIPIKQPRDGYRKHIPETIQYCFYQKVTNSFRWERSAFTIYHQYYPVVRVYHTSCERHISKHDLIQLDGRIDVCDVSVGPSTTQSSNVSETSYGLRADKIIKAVPREINGAREVCIEDSRSQKRTKLTAKATGRQASSSEPSRSESCPAAT
jgi:hypothetical protein